VKSKLWSEYKDDFSTFQDVLLFSHNLIN
jgi:hypothetical protein